MLFSWKGRRNEFQMQTHLRGRRNRGMDRDGTPDKENEGSDGGSGFRKGIVLHGDRRKIYQRELYLHPGTECRLPGIGLERRPVEQRASDRIDERNGRGDGCFRSKGNDGRKGEKPGSGTMSRELFQLVKESVTARQAAEAYGLKVNRSGMCRCPFHGDQNPSMKLDERYYCFGCGVTGDAIDLTAKLFGINTKTAAEKLAKDFGINYSGRGSPKEPDVGKPQILAEPETELKKWILKAMDTLIRYSHLIREWKERYAPQRMDDEFHPLFVDALQNGAKVEYLLDEIFTGGRGADREFYETYGKEITEIERRLERYEHGNAGKDRSDPGRAYEEADR